MMEQIHHGKSREKVLQELRGKCINFLYKIKHLLCTGTREFDNVLSVYLSNCCHQMSDFKAKMRQIRFRLGLHARSRWGSLQRSPDPLAGFKGAYF